jgi:hypothetical protein
MNLRFVRKTKDICFNDSCPARWDVLDVPGGAVFVGKELDPETYDLVREHVGPGEHAVYVPKDLL